jgi:hypothetical protein
MKNTVTHIIILLAICLTACQQNKETDTNTNNLLLGTWVEPSYDGEKTTYKRSVSLQENEYGISFLNNGVLIERTSGWCGTPPLSFNDVEGSYAIKNSVIEIDLGYYPGDTHWKILSVSEDVLQVTLELTEQEKDNQELLQLFSEIESIASSVSCTNTTDWAFTAYGAKACGGAQGYIAYSTNIDVEDFLNKIDTYTNLEQAYNTKWNIVSTCEALVPPKEVVCENGVPVLKY